MRTMIFIGMAVFACGVAASSARAGVTVTATEENGDVVFAASGTLNLGAWTFDNPGDFLSTIEPSLGPVLIVGPAVRVTGDIYGSPQNYSKPSNFGTGGNSDATSGSGDLLGFISNRLTVPAGYVSGDPLSGSATYVGETFASLGMATGTYTWKWGRDATADSLTLEVKTSTTKPPPNSSAPRFIHKAVTCPRIGALLVSADASPISITDITVTSNALARVVIKFNPPLKKLMNVNIKANETVVSNFGEGVESQEGQNLKLDCSGSATISVIIVGSGTI